MNAAFLLEIFPDFLNAAKLTIGISFASAALGALAGYVINAAFLFLPRRLYVLYRVYVWIFRGTPFLVQLFLIYYGLPVIGLKPSAIEASILSLSLYASAYFAEIFRASWNSIPKGHLEAALSLGISRWSSFFTIQSPQALRFALPLITNQTLLIIKESALTSIITVPELTMTAGRIVAETFTFVEPYLILALMYWLLTYITARLGRRIERSYKF